ncbi:MAG: hypothetical protein LBU56_02720 [Rickettsiales bacterium]|jgi:hypothetical protein|nr:hypothetical protein [Rickettsiales bacterium]
MKEKEIQEFLKFFGVAGAVTGALTGWVLSFTALSPLAIGKTIGFTFPAFLYIGALLHKFYKKEPIDKEFIIFFGTIALTSAAIGVGLAAAITAISPSAMLGTGSLASTGAVIRAIALIAGSFVAEEVNKHIISPIIEHCFSKEKEV